MSASPDVLETVETSIAVVVTDESWAKPLIRWASYEADQRHSSVRIVDRSGPGELARLARRGHTLDLEGPPPAMIVVGPVERGVLVDLVFESFSPDCPVVVVPRRAWALSLPRGERAIITVGFNGSRPSSAALRWAVGEAKRRDASIRAVLAWAEGPYGGLGGCVPVDTHVHGFPAVAAQDLTVQRVIGIGLRSGDVIPVARRGSPTHVLVHEAVGSDLLVVGAGQSVVHHHRVLGPTTLGCVAGSPVPVAIVRSA
jgi:nucleotide-binding universal stress UspA family protein